MVRLLITLTVCLCLPVSALAAAKYAVVVGINKYECKVKKGGPGRSVPYDLDGAVNDAKYLREILVGRFSFQETNITALYNENASRTRILGSLDEMLKKAGEGDMALFYYAGHGSQMKNSKSKESDGLDETIVPADACTGAPDIRDKELARVYHKFLDKKIRLVVIMDSCYSGSAARAVYSAKQPKKRFANLGGGDAADDYHPSQKPEDRGALILSATLDYQSAWETTDERKLPRGLFTYSLIKVLNSVPADETSGRVYSRIRAVMQAQRPDQEPVIEGLPERQQQPIFGDVPPEMADRTCVAAVKVKGNIIELQGGYAIGLAEQCELMRMKKAESEPEVAVRVTQVKDLNSSIAEIVSGDAKSIKPGDLFEVKKWVVPAESVLRAWIPSGEWKHKDLKAFAADLYAGKSGVEWVTDPKATTPTHILLWDGAAWSLSLPDGTSVVMGAKPNKKDIYNKIKETAGKGACFFLSLPPDVEMAGTIKSKIEGYNNAIEFSGSQSGAHYLLAGRYNGSAIEYAWILPDMTEKDIKGNFALPLESNWENGEATESAAKALHGYAVSLARIVGWLTFDNPGGGTFPYRLALKDKVAGAIIGDRNLVDGEEFSLVLVADRDRMKKTKKKVGRHVYVFSIDSNGEMNLLYGKDNLIMAGPGSPAIMELADSGFTVKAPFGTDTFFMITSEEAVPRPDLVFKRKGVSDRGTDTARGKGAMSDFLLLIDNYGAAARGKGPVATKPTWSVERLTYRSVEKQ